MNFFYENLQIQKQFNTWILPFGSKKFVFVRSSCIYPKLCKQPMKEEYLLSGPLEESNDAYALAKIAVKMCDYYSRNYNLNFKSLMPPNLYGPNDNYNHYQIPFLSSTYQKNSHCQNQ